MDTPRFDFVALGASALLLFLGGAGLAAANAQTSDIAPSAASAHEKSDIDKARDRMIAAKRFRITYTKKFDLSGLPEYKPEAQVSGVIHMWGANYFTDSPLADYWAEDFRRYEPGVTFDFQLRSSQHAISSLIFGKSDISPLGRSITTAERLAFQREFNYQPFGVIAVTGSYTLSGWNPAIGIYVNSANPISKLSMEQLDGIFGAMRTGGWNGITWDPSIARGPDKNIRTWGQLGLKGKWKNLPIRVFGYTLKYNFPDEIHNKVFHGGYKWNEALEEYANKTNPDGSLYIAGQQMIDDLAKTPGAIAYVAGGVSMMNPKVKLVPLSVKTGGAPIALTLDNVQNRTYPLTGEVYFYMNRPPGKPLPPKVREFMRYVLSRQGQEQVERDGKYLPLTAELSRQETAKLN